MEYKNPLLINPMEPPPIYYYFINKAGQLFRYYRYDNTMQSYQEDTDTWRFLFTIHNNDHFEEMIKNRILLPVESKEAGIFFHIYNNQKWEEMDAWRILEDNL